MLPPFFDRRSVILTLFAAVVLGVLGVHTIKDDPLISGRSLLGDVGSSSSSSTPTPTASLNSMSYSSGEASDFTVQINLDTSSHADVTIGWHLSYGTADASDFNMTSGTVIISNGNSTGFAIVDVNDDASYEGDQNATFVLDPGSGYTVGSPSSATLTIQDNDAASSSSSSSSVSAVCGNAVVESGEQCESGDCCNTGTCQYKTLGTSCMVGDGNECTTDTCPGNATSCVYSTAGTDGNSCNSGSGVCASGVCSSSSSSSSSSAVCGNSIVESGEQCEAGACCNLVTCQYKLSSTSCTSDANECTTDQCNGSSTVCGHTNVANNTSCDSGNGTCQSGTCTPNPSSSSSAAPVCGDGVCNGSDECDGSDYCASYDSCSDFAAPYGVVSCNVDCTTNSSACEMFICGDNICNGSDTCSNCSADCGLCPASSSSSSSVAAPSAPGIPDLVTASDTGSSSTDNITKDNTPTFSVGSCTNGDTVEIFLGGVGTGSTGTCGALDTGIAYVTLGATSDGAVSVTAKETNAGGTSTASGPLVVTIDTVAPSAPGTPDMDSGSDSGTSNSDNITNDDTPTFTVSCESGATVEISDGTTTVGSGTCSGGTATITSSSFVDGSYAIISQQTDVAGNVSGTSSSLAIVIDRVASSAPGTPDLAAASDSGTSTDNITNVTSPVFNGTCVTGEIVTLYVDGSSNGTFTCASSAYTITVLAALSDGSPSITAKQTDTAGNQSGPSGGLSITVNTASTSAPGAPDLITLSDSGVSSSDDITADNTPTLTGTCSGTNTVSLINAGTNGTIASGTCSSGTYTLTPSALTDNTYSFVAKQTNNVGTVSIASSALSVVIDTTAPAAPGTPDLIASSDTGGSDSDNYTNDTTPTFEISCEPDATLDFYDGGVSAGSTSCVSGTATITSSTLAAGLHSVTSIQTDKAGNVSPSSGALAFTIDLSICGDGTVNTGEQCDDGNNSTGDGCNSNCALEFCGDGVLQSALGEKCDMGTLNTPNGENGCRSSCTVPGGGGGGGGGGDDGFTLSSSSSKSLPPGCTLTNGLLTCSSSSSSSPSNCTYINGLWKCSSSSKKSTPTLVLCCDVTKGTQLGVMTSRDCALQYWLLPNVNPVGFGKGAAAPQSCTDQQVKYHVYGNCYRPVRVYAATESQDLLKCPFSNGTSAATGCTSTEIQPMNLPLCSTGSTN
jgi:cysteine-rich repeat protein